MLADFITQKEKQYDLPYPAERWEEGSIIGNGIQGAIIMGGAAEEHVILSHEKLFAPVYQDLQPIQMAEHLPEIRELLKEGEPEKATQIILDLFKKQEHREEKYWTNPFFPAAELVIRTDNCPYYKDYHRKLKFETGESNISFCCEQTKYNRSAFFSRADQIMELHLTASNPSEYVLELRQRPYQKDGRKVLHALFPDEQGNYFFKPQTGVEKMDNTIWYACGYHNRKNGYAVICQIGDTDGIKELEKGKLRLYQVKDTDIWIRIFCVEDMSLLEQEIKKQTKELQQIRKRVNSEEIYTKLLDAHKQIHTERYNRVEFKLPENPHLEEIFHAGRYAILSASGDTPPNLQGVWTGTYDAGWSSDYTQNGNLQTAIQALLQCGDFESMHSYFKYQESMMPDYRKNSQVLYGCRGIHVPSRTSDCGIDFHFDKTWPMIFWTAGAAWVAHFYYDYWLYTGDREFFEQHALPFMKEAALFYEDYLFEDENGKWVFSPSYSPENTPLNYNNSACINATMDISIAKELFHNLIIGCSTLEIESENIEQWKKVLEKMPEYQINKDGALKEWADYRAEDRYDHRHSSHLYMLYYDDASGEEKRILDACKKAYEFKMYYKKEEKGTMAFGLIQAGMAAAHLRDREMTETMIQAMADNNYYRTYASAHDYGPSIFNTDISGGMPSLMLETIVQCFPVIDKNNKIESYRILLLPALADSMERGLVKGIHLRGGFILDMEWKDGKVQKYNIRNPRNNKYQIDK